MCTGALSTRFGSTRNVAKFTKFDFSVLCVLELLLGDEEYRSAGLRNNLEHLQGIFNGHRNLDELSMGIKLGLFIREAYLGNPSAFSGTEINSSLVHGNYAVAKIGKCRKNCENTVRKDGPHLRYLGLYMDT